MNRLPPRFLWGKPDGSSFIVERINILANCTRGKDITIAATSERPATGSSVVTMPT